MNKQMTILWNRINDSIYKICSQEGIDYKAICNIQGEVKKQIELNPNKQNPYLKKPKENERVDQILSGVGKYDLKDFIQKMSLTLRDLMLILEGKREQIKKIKDEKSISSEWVSFNEDKLNKILSELLVYQDILFDLEYCNGNETEMNQIIQRMINESE